jgi:hypothetical protein
MSIEKKMVSFLAIPSILQKFSQTYQTLLDKVNEDNLYTSMVCRSFHHWQVFKEKSVLGFGKKGFESNNSNVMRWWQDELLLQQT